MTRLRGVLAAMLAILLMLTPSSQAADSVEMLTHPPPAASAGPDAPVEGDATAIDYGLIAALVAVVIVAPLTPLESSIHEKFTLVSAPVGGGTAGCSASAGGTTTQTAQHSPGGQIESIAGADAVFADGGSAHVSATAVSDFANLVFRFEEQASVVNSTCARDAPNVKLTHELDWTLKLLAQPVPPDPPPSEMAQLRVDFDFAQLAWGIGGPVPGQDGVFEIEGPDGSTWGWTMVKNPTTGMLEITSRNGPALADFVFDSGANPVTIQGLEFQPPEVLRGVGDGPSFNFEIPYGVPTDVTFKVRRKSHTSVPDPPSVPALPLGARLALALALLALGWTRPRRRLDGTAAPAGATEGRASARAA